MSLRAVFLKTFPPGDGYVELLQEEGKTNHAGIFRKIPKFRHYYEETIINVALQQAVTYKRTEVEFI
ncbi:hypothetical protein ACRS6Y_13325 [Bacillus cytotoxicus]|uniref:hypothetical protein n=1 Tax=Bacillus cytotoxicus TaxID=580165 RepID=UPI003D7E1849